MPSARKRWGFGLFLFSYLLLCSPPLLAQVGIGEVVELTENRAESFQPPWGPLNWGDRIDPRPRRQLRTSAKLVSRLGVRLDKGGKFVLGENAAITVAQPVPPTADRVDLILAGGEVRAVTAGTEIVILTPTSGQATLTRTEAIVSCGPPVTTALDICLFVGVSGTTQVTSAGVTVSVERQFYTYVQGSNPPNPNPALPLSNDQFYARLDATTIVGTGTPQDQLAVTPFPLPGLPSPGPERPRRDPFDQPDTRPVPDQPLGPYESLPPPPGPPPVPKF